MVVTIEDFRQELQKMIEKYDGMISYLKDGRLIHPFGQDPEQATASWLEKLSQQRSELEEVLAQLPSG